MTAPIYNYTLPLRPEWMNGKMLRPNLTKAISAEELVIRNNLPPNDHINRAQFGGYFAVARLGITDDILPESSLEEVLIGTETGHFEYSKEAMFVRIFDLPDEYFLHPETRHQLPESDQKIYIFQGYHEDFGDIPSIIPIERNRSPVCQLMIFGDIPPKRPRYGPAKVSLPPFTVCKTMARNLVYVNQNESLTIGEIPEDFALAVWIGCLSQVDGYLPLSQTMYEKFMGDDNYIELKKPDSKIMTEMKSAYETNVYRKDGVIHENNEIIWVLASVLIISAALKEYDQAKLSNVVSKGINALNVIANLHLKGWKISTGFVTAAKKSRLALRNNLAHIATFYESGKIDDIKAAEPAGGSLYRTREYCGTLIAGYEMTSYLCILDFISRESTKTAAHVSNTILNEIREYKRQMALICGEGQPICVDKLKWFRLKNLKSTIIDSSKIANLRYCAIRHKMLYVGGSWSNFAGLESMRPSLGTSHLNYLVSERLFVGQRITHMMAR